MARTRVTLQRAAARQPALPVRVQGGLYVGAPSVGGLATRRFRTGVPTFDATIDRWASGASSGEVLGLPAAGRALHLLTGLICQLPLEDLAPDFSRFPVRPILDQPWPMMGTSEWLTYQVQALMMRGDAYALPTDHDAEGYPRQLVPLHPDHVLTDVDPDTGEVRERLITTDGVVTFGPTELWHARGLTLRADGLRGVGVIEQYRAALGGIVSQQQYAEDIWQGSGVPTGILKVNLPEIPQEKAIQVRADWLMAHSTAGPAVLSQMFDFQPLAWNPSDVQFLESRRFSIAEVAYMFNLDPSDLDASMGSAMTYSNREQRAYERLLSSLGPILVRIEQAYRYFIPLGHRARFYRDVLLWADSQTRANVQDIQLANRTMTLNEARAQEGRPLYREGDSA